MIYFLDYQKNDTVFLKDVYTAYTDVVKNIEKTATDYIKKFQGENQVSICRQYDKNIDKILIDPILEKGMYLIKGELDNEIILCEKTLITIPGTLWNSSELKVNKIGKFGITDIVLDLTMEKCSCNNTKIKSPNKIKEKIPYPFIPALIEVLQKTNCGLSSMEDNERKRELLKQHKLKIKNIKTEKLD